jgi:hypothetical protein
MTGAIKNFRLAKNGTRRERFAGSTSAEYCWTLRVTEGEDLVRLDEIAASSTVRMLGDQDGGLLLQISGRGVPGFAVIRAELARPFGDQLPLRMEALMIELID